MTKNAVIEVIAQEQKCRPEDIHLNTRLADLGIDSLRAITILYQLEEQFDIEIPNELIETIVTVEDVIREIDGLRRNNVPGCPSA
jgi:acyl carrier protein